MDSTKYHVKFVNNSLNYGSVCIYQTNPNLDANVMPLAWITKQVHSSTSVIFEWTNDYGFTWSETGELKPGVIFTASQVWLADSKYSNLVTFKYIDHAYTFDNQTSGNKSGIFYIEQDNTIPIKTASVGISVSGSSAFVTQAQPNLLLMFKPKPEYWITFGNYTLGEVLNLTEITNKQKLIFGSNVHHMQIILNEDNSWTVIRGGSF